MQEKDSQKKIVALRTFAQDVLRAKGDVTSVVAKPDETTHDSKGIVTNEEKTPPAVLPTPKAESFTTDKMQEDVTPQKHTVDKPHRKLLSLKKAPVVPKAQPTPPVEPVEKETPMLNTKYAQLSNEVAVVSDHVVKSSILSDDASIYDTELGGGTIIRDTKRKRFRLIPAMIEAVQGWLVSRKATYQKKREPYKVAKAESRKETIKAAVERSQTAPTEDFATVVKRLKEVPRTKIDSTLTFKKKADLPKPTWTHLADESSTAVSQESVTPPPPQEPEQTEPPTEVVEVPSLSASESEEEIAPQEVQEGEPQTITQEEVVETEVTPQEVVDIEESTPPQTVVPLPVTTSVPQYQTSTAGNVPRFPYALLFGVILITTALGMGTSYYFFVIRTSTPSTPTTSTPTVEPPALVDTASREPIRMENKEQLLQELLVRSQERTSVTQFYPTVLKHEQEIPATALEVFTTLQTHTQESFNRNVKALTFGAVGNGQPFLILEITNFDLAFSGMLQWEKNMSADLYPLFGEIVRQTYDQTARTSTQLQSAYFKDAIANNTIVRILLDEEGADRIIYTFVDRDTIVITTTRATLQSLLPQVQ